MPAKNPRLTITLSPSLGAVLKRLSHLSGNSQSGLISELLDGSVPVFERLITVLEAAHAAKAELRQSMVAELDAAQTKLESQLGLALEIMDTSFKPILEVGEAVQRRAAGAGGPRSRGGLAPAARLATPPSNRGVRSNTKPTKTSAKKVVNHGPV